MTRAHEFDYPRPLTSGFVTTADDSSEHPGQNWNLTKEHDTAGRGAGGVPGGVQLVPSAPPDPAGRLWCALVAWAAAVDGIDVAAFPEDDRDPFASTDIAEDSRAFLLDFIPVALPKLADALADVAADATTRVLAERGAR